MKQKRIHNNVVIPHCYGFVVRYVILGIVTSTIHNHRIHSHYRPNTHYLHIADSR